MTIPLIGKHLTYDYPGLGRYEVYYQSESLVVYRIHGGPMRGRSAYQRAYYQPIDPDITMISWVEETGTVVTTVVNLRAGTVSGCAAFSQGHWERNEDAHGDKRVPEDLERWRELSKVGGTDPGRRVVKCDHAKIVKVEDGPGELLPVEEEGAVFF